MAAALSNKLDIIKYLWEQGCRFEEQDEEGDTILHKAAINGDLDLLRFLIDDAELHPLLLRQNLKGNIPIENLLSMNAKQILPK
jgi:ankyrin repeat protein